MFHLLTLYRWLRRNGLRNVVEREVQIVQDKQFEIGSVLGNGKTMSNEATGMPTAGRL
jgi:hypothetical protein